MLSRFSDIDRSIAVMDQLRRRMDRMFDEVDRGPARGETVEWLGRGTYPTLRLFDAGASLVLQADVPGIGEKDVQVTLQEEVLTLTGERKADAPEGYHVHRQERAPIKFARSFSLPCRVDPEKSTAVVKDGVMTITLAKAAGAQPRQIAIKAL